MDDGREEQHQRSGTDAMRAALRYRPGHEWRVAAVVAQGITVGRSIVRGEGEAVTPGQGALHLGSNPPLVETPELLVPVNIVVLGDKVAEGREAAGARRSAIRSLTGHSRRLSASHAATCAPGRWSRRARE